MASGSEHRREFHVTDVIRTGLPRILRSRPSRIREHPEGDTTVKLTPEAVDCGADVRIAAQGPATGQKDCERKVQTTDTLIEVAMIRLLLRRLREQGEPCKKLLE